MDRTDSTTRVAQPDYGGGHRSSEAATAGPRSRAARVRFCSLGMIGALVLSLTLSVGSLAAGGASRPTLNEGSVAAVAVSCNDTGAANHVKAPKTKFVIHSALAFGVFHHFIYKPYKAGDFKAGAHHRTLKLVAAAASGLFVYHQLHEALTAAQSDPTLSHLVAPITGLQNAIKDLGTKMKGGSASSQDFEGSQNQIESLRSQASSAGAPVQDCAA